jgi:hypothetical protein
VAEVQHHIYFLLVISHALVSHQRGGITDIKGESGGNIGNNRVLIDSGVKFLNHFSPLFELSCEVSGVKKRFRP